MVWVNLTKLVASWTFPLASWASRLKPLVETAQCSAILAMLDDESSASDAAEESEAEQTTRR